MLTDGHVARFDINIWESKMAKKLAANTDHYLTKALHMAYVNSHVDGKVYKHLVAKLRIGARKPFATAKEMFEVLQKAYGNINRAHTAMNKFQDLKMTKDFNSFWAEFQVLASELNYNESTLISELKFKLTSLLSQAMAGDVSWPTNIHEYAKQCQHAYQDLKPIEIHTPADNFDENWYNRGGTNTNTNTGMNANTKMVNCSKCSANFLYSHLSSVASLNYAVATHPTCSKATRLIKDKISKLQQEDQYFHCKEVRNHRSQYSKEW